MSNPGILNTSKDDLHQIRWLFGEAIALQGKRGYQVWQHIDEISLKQDIENGLQYKILINNDIGCIFSIQYNDPFIWGDRDQNNAIYLHRIVTNPLFKGQRLFEKILDWTGNLALEHNRNFLRMDTWAENTRLIHYYQSFGFTLIDYFTTGDIAELPVQNRNLKVALLELEVR